MPETTSSRMASNQPVQGDDPLAKLKFHMTDVMNPHQFTMFSGQYITPYAEREAATIAEIEQALAKMPSDNVDGLLSAYIGHLSSCHNQAQVIFFLGVLPALVKKKLFNSKTLCLSLITHLQFDQPLMWIEGLNVLKNQIGAVDYKGCRDLLKNFLNRIASLPLHMPQSAKRKVDKTVEVLGYILGRDSCLLPAYMAQTEIAVQYKGTPPHWIVSDVLLDFHRSFRPLVDAISMPGRKYLRPVISSSSIHNFLWKVEHLGLNFPCKGALPFDQEVSMAQWPLVMSTLRQPNSRDMVMHMLNPEKKQPRSPSRPILEELLADAIITLMEDSEVRLADDASATGTEARQLAMEAQWGYISCLLTYFPLHTLASLSDVVKCLHKKIMSSRVMLKSRQDLMWLLLQVVGNHLSRTSDPQEQEAMTLCIDMYNHHFQQSEPFPVPAKNDPRAVKKLAGACLMFLLKKKLGDSVKHDVPSNLKLQLSAIEGFLSELLLMKTLDSYHMASAINAASLQYENHRNVSRYIGELLMGPQSAYTLPAQSGARGTPPTKPCSLAFLDSLTVHVRVSILLQIAQVIQQHSAQFQRGLPPSPALLETYSRLLHSLETESFGVKSFQSTVLPTVVRHRSLPTLNALIEVLAYHMRLHHIQPHYRTALLAAIFQEANVGPSSSNQLFLNVEAAALRLIASCVSAEMQKEFARLGNDIKHFVIHEADEVNRAFALTVARSLHVSGCDSHASGWVDAIMKTLQGTMNFTWSEQVVKSIPRSLQTYFPLSTTPLATQELLDKVDREWQAFQAMNIDAAVSSFKQNTTHTFFCLMWKQLREANRLTTVFLRIAESLQPRQISNHLRTFCDYLVVTHAQKTQNSHEAQEKSMDTLRDMVWKYDVIPLDKFVITMLMRNYDLANARVSLYIMQMLLLKHTEFRKRVTAFVKNVSPCFWLAEDSYKEHQDYLKMFPETFRYEGLARAVGEQLRMDSNSQTPYLGNVCLRFLPAFDLLIHRLLEMMPAVTWIVKSTITILDFLGHLYRFHEQPVIFLYSTLHYYESTLVNCPLLKKKLVSTIVTHQQLTPSNDWCLSSQYQTYLSQADNAASLSWDVPYYTQLLTKLVKTFNSEDGGFPNLDWRFVEFSNAVDLAVHCTCLELLALPCSGDTVVTDLLESMIVNVMKMQDEKEVISWINAVASILVMLPESFWGVLMCRIVYFLNQMVNEEKQEMELGGNETKSSSSRSSSMGGRGLKVNLLGWEHSSKPIVQRWRICLTMSRAFWHHSTIGQMSGLADVIRRRLKPIVTTERQLLFVFQMVGPILHRMNEERTRCLLDLVVELYGMLKVVDQNCVHLEYLDMYCDYLYHLKYMFVGEHSKVKLEEVFKDLRPELQARLRFMLSSPSTQVQA